MEKYISKDALVAEIERSIANYKKISVGIDKKGDDWVYSMSMLNAKIDVLQHILYFLDTLEVKEIQKKNLYVVTRCEEHSDYVEKAFFSKEKAENYCKQFEGNEDAYGRDITEIEVDYPLEVKEVDLMIHTIITECCDWLTICTDLSHDLIEDCRNLMLTVKDEQLKAQKGE